MSGHQQFICYPCGQSWRDKYSFWNGYQSTCPICGKAREAVRDTQAYADQQEWRGFCDAPLFDFDGEHVEKTEADVEAEGDIIRDEIAEALGAMEADMSDVDDSDADADSEGADSGEGF